MTSRRRSFLIHPLLDTLKKQHCRVSSNSYTSPVTHQSSPLMITIDFIANIIQYSPFFSPLRKNYYKNKVEISRLGLGVCACIMCDSIPLHLCIYLFKTCKI